MRRLLSLGGKSVDRASLRIAYTEGRDGAGERVKDGQGSQLRDVDQGYWVWKMFRIWDGVAGFENGIFIVSVLFQTFFL